MARRRGSALTIEDISFALGNPIGAAILTWSAIALAGIGSIALTIQLIAWASSDILEKHEQSLWADYGTFVNASDIARVQFAAKMVAAATAVGLTLIVAFAVITEVRWLAAIVLFGPVPLFASVIWWLVQTYILHKTAEKGKLAQALEAHKTRTIVALPRPVEPKTPSTDTILADQIQNMPHGQTNHIPTRLGKIRIIRCANGSLRLYWPPNTPLMERAKAVVSGRAEYNSDHKAWFVHKAFERGVLLDLAQL
ncbi:MAG: hypothetical protein EOO38_21175 [Cytophagaceae bacterium]|nr:MAG: hypothetical protein EOO38_21175 [Cytophagaceae bacterium]